MVGKKKSVFCSNPSQVVLTESLRATDEEKSATSKSLYGDSAARISSNVAAIHDRIRHRAYEAVLRNVRGKSVLHLSCGMGLYSMLAARAMASQVVAIDTSAVVEAARVVAEQNQLKNITFLRGRLRDVLSQLPCTQFDVVLCEWMGALLLNESILADVLYARDHLLTPTGVVCPNRSSLHVAGVSDYGFRLDTEDYWSNVYGFRMEPMKALVRREVEMCAIPAENLVTTTCLAHTVNLDALPALTAAEKAEYEAAAQHVAESRLLDNPVEARWVPTSSAQAGFEAAFTLTVTRNTTVNYLTFYVDAGFVSAADIGANFMLGIHPGGRNAWTEVSVGLRVALPVCEGEKITGTVRAFTPADKGGKITVVEVTAATEGRVANISTSGQYFYQAY